MRGPPCAGKWLPQGLRNAAITPEAVSLRNTEPARLCRVGGISAVMLGQGSGPRAKSDIGLVTIATEVPVSDVLLAMNEPVIGQSQRLRCNCRKSLLSLFMVTSFRIATFCRSFRGMPARLRGQTA